MTTVRIGTNSLTLFLLYHFIDLALGTLQNRIQALLATITGIGNLFIGTDQTPKCRLLRHDSSIILDIGGSRYCCNQIRQEIQSTDLGRHILLGSQPILQSDKVNGLSFIVQVLRGVYFVPNILGGLIVGYIFSFIFTYIISCFGARQCTSAFWKISILASEKYAWIGVLVVGVWQAVAMNTIIYISGLQTVPADIYEAGMIDGANPWQKFWKLTFPMLLPFVSINLILSTKNMMMVFDQIMSLTKGGPAQSTESISYLIYKNGMDGGQFGFQSANAVVFFIVIVAFSIIQMKITGKKEEQL